MAEIRGERIRALMELKGWSQSELARRVGLKQPSINRLIVGDTRSSSALLDIARALDTTAQYLTGETDEVAASGVAAPRHGFRVEPVPAESPQAAAEQLNSILIPQLSIGYSMGGGSVFDDYQQTAMVPMPRDWLRPLIRGRFDELFIARGDGDSMTPTLLDGDLVVVDTAQKDITQQDRLWCLSYGDLGMIKRVRRLPGGGYQINSDNPAVTPITAYDGELHVIGRVVWIGRRA